MRSLARTHANKHTHTHRVSMLATMMIYCRHNTFNWFVHEHNHEREWVSECLCQCQCVLRSFSCFRSQKEQTKNEEKRNASSVWLTFDESKVKVLLFFRFISSFFLFHSFLMNNFFSIYVDPFFILLFLTAKNMNFSDIEKKNTKSRTMKLKTNGRSLKFFVQ